MATAFTHSQGTPIAKASNETGVSKDGQNRGISLKAIKEAHG